MCLNIYSNTIRTNTKPVPKVATKDIYVYKVINVHPQRDGTVMLESTFQDFIYTPGVVNSLGRGLSVSRSYGGTKWQVHEGFHAYTKVEDAIAASDYECGNDYVFVCIIPKGSHYLTGTGLCCANHVSTELIVLRRDDPRSLAKLANLPPKSRQW